MGQVCGPAVCSLHPSPLLSTSPGLRPPSLESLEGEREPTVPSGAHTENLRPNSSIHPQNKLKAAGPAAADLEASCNSARSQL